ncbi:MAG TPA: aspartate/glutamate racemase family protein [Solirubrobacteraceae bacterium]|nr:aspartate/glutamate racemase family protein [Solirubrobacteraceae bacterium]
MRILVINPNTTAAMTSDIAAQAQRYAHPESEVEAISPRWGPASIEGHLEDELAAVATLEAVAERAGDYDGVIIACYGDPGLYAAREVSPVPVVGIAEASMLMACMVAHRFSVVTVLPRIKPLVEDVVARYGLSGRCASVRATSLAVLDIERDPDAAQREITAEAGKAIAADGAEAICLGCAGMGPLDRHVQETLDVPVIDGVAAAVKMLEALSGYGLATSRVAAFKRPEPKQLTGETDVLRAFRAGAAAAEPLKT